MAAAALSQSSLGRSSPTASASSSLRVPSTSGGSTRGRPRALSEIFFGDDHHDEDDDDLEFGRKGGDARRRTDGSASDVEGASSSPGKAPRARAKFNKDSFNLLALDLGKWINANPSPQEAPLDPFFIPSPSPSLRSLDGPFSPRRPSRPGLNVTDGSDTEDPSRRCVSGPRDIPKRQEGDDEPPRKEPRAPGWQGSPRGKVLIPRSSGMMDEWDEREEKGDDGGSGDEDGAGATTALDGLRSEMARLQAR